MALSLTLEFSDNDLDHFRAVLAKSAEHAAGQPPEKIIEAARGVLAQSRQGELPGFIGERLGQLEDLLAMLVDEGWSLPEEDRQRVLSALVYFADPDDVIPDEVPVLGFLDDAIMIELCGEALAPELEAYAEFCEFRDQQARTRGVDPAQVGHAEWLEAKRQALQERMHQRRRDFGVGYGRSEGYAHKRGSYVRRGWRPPVDHLI